MQPHHRAHAGGGHGIGGLEIRINIALHFSLERREIASAKLTTPLNNSGSALQALVPRPRSGLRRLVKQVRCGLLQDCQFVP
jgi:hypothetical protein